MARGLQFDPYGNLGFPSFNNNQSVPTVASNYNQGFKVQSLPIPKIEPNSPLSNAWNSYQTWRGLNETEKYDPLYDINKWEEGLSGLSEDEKSLWKKQNYDKINGKSEVWQNRLWKNQQFANTFGIDAFNSMPNAEERDIFYSNYLADKAIEKKFKGNKNIEQLRSLTAQGKKELLQSDYQSDFQINNAERADKDKEWTDYSLSERWNAIANNVPEYALSGMAVGSIAGATVGGGLSFGTLTLPGSAGGGVLGGIVGALFGAGKGIVSPEDAQGYNQAQRRIDNEEILNKITVADNERKKQESQGEIGETFSSYLQAYQQGQLTTEDVDKMFDDIALSRKETSVDEFGNTNEYEYTGSNYYTIFKNDDEFEHFNTLDKLRYIAQTQVLGRKYGQGSALSVLDQDMQNYISDNQNGWQWAGNSIKNVWVGGVANLGMTAAGLGALGARMFYGTEGLNNYLQGKDASGDGSDNFLNPQYLEKVDQYNTFDTDVIDKAEKNGGISPYNNVITPGTEGDFWSWNTMNEALRMNKFTWSQLIQNYGLGKLIKGATRIAGGIEMAPGILAQESTAASKIINKVGSVGVLGSSSLGIDAAYGMQTYDEVLRKNNQRLDQIIDADTEAIVKERLQSPEAQKEFRQYVDAENARRKVRAGENNSYIGVDEEKAWQDYIAHITRQVREEQANVHAKDRKQAELDAANAYAIDATLEGMRMTSTNAAFKSYLFDKGTLNALRNNNPYVGVTTKNGMYALGKHATRNKAMQIFGTNVWGGFHSNYFDDVTVGFAEGFGIQDYNNYLLQKYNPATYGAVLDDYVSPFVAAMAGANNAMTEKRSFIDGGIGAIGSVFSFMPNVGGMLSHKKMMEQAAKAAEERGEKGIGLSGWETISHYINNPIIQAVADAKSATRMTESEIKRVNDILKNSGYSLDNMSETLAALNNKAIAREGTSLLEAEDAKDREAFTLVQNLLSMKNSGVVANAQAEPDKAKWSWKKKAGHTINQSLNTILGMPVFEEAASSYQNAMQQLQDASMLDQVAESEEQAERQQRMIDTFLGLDTNKNSIQNLDAEESEAFARERLKKNADNLLDMMDRTEKIQQNFEKSIAANIHPHVAQQLMYQYALDGRWKQRLSELEGQITGDEETLQSNDARNTIAKYGSMQGYERAKKAQEKRVKEAEDAYDKAKSEAKKENNHSKSLAENARQKAMRFLAEKTAKKNVEKERAALRTIEADEPMLKNSLEGETPIIKAEQILRLQADDRLRILDDFYRNDYSTEQQAEIDRAKSLMMQDGTSINEAMERIKDAAILTHRIEDNMEAARRIMQNPAEARMMQQALEENRKKAIIDYFNDKIVGEAFLDFQNDTESLLNKENVVRKAEGYSSAVLNRMLRTIEKEMKRVRTSEEMDDKTLSTLEDGIKEVLGQRDEQLKETSDLDKFIRKTKKVNHTEVQLQEGAPETAVNPETGEISMQYAEAITTERELSDNDKKILDYALDYAAERGIPVEELPEKVQGEDFDKYVEQRNHAYDIALNPVTGDVRESNVGVVENRANSVSPEYRGSLVGDVINAFKTNKDAVQAVKADKPIADKPKSVVTPSIETKGEKPTVQDQGEGRPDDVKATSGNIFAGLTKSNPTTSQEETSAVQEGNTDRNSQILEEASALNGSLIEDVGILLEEVDRMAMDNNTREKLKDIISSHLNSRTFNNIAELQNKVLEDAIITSEKDAPMIGAKATALTGLNVSDIKARKKGIGSTVNTNEDSEEINNNPDPLPPAPLILETRDLDALIKYPVWADYIQSHNVVGFLQKLADLWNQEREAWIKDNKQGLLHQSQVVFIYDPAFASQIEDSYGNRTYNPEIDAPIIMALEITEKNKQLVENENQLITIKDKTDNKEHKYQMIGGMPASQVSTADSDIMKATAMRMGAIRDRINFSDENAHVLRYAPNNNTGKYNGSVIRTNIEKITSHTEEDRMPHATEETPKKSVQQLMDENTSNTTESLVDATEEEKQAYEEAKSKGLAALRATNLYKKLRKAFIERLVKKERKGKSEEDSNNKEMDFRIQKGTSDTYPKIVLTKKISETNDKNTGRPIVELLKEISTEGSNAEEVINSNSRFHRLFDQLKKLKMPSGLFNQNGEIVNRANYNKEIAELEKSIGAALDNNLNVFDRHVKVDISEGTPTEKTVKINVYSGDINNSDNLLATLTTNYNGQISEAEYTSFLKDLILDKEGNTRPNPEFRDFERVKWQVNYEDAEVANDKSKSYAERKPAIDNLNDLYDDGVFEMQVTKLVYPSRSVTVSINPAMKKLYPETKVAPQVPAPAATETHTVYEAEGPAGKIDSDTGMATETPTRESIIGGIPRIIIDTVNRILEDSKTRNLDDNGNYYDIAGQLWSRVTSIKYALEGFIKDRFNPNSVWTVPSSLIGNSVDEFGRDVFNGVFDKMSEEERNTAFGTYDNSTSKNYSKVFMSLKAFEARLAQQGQAIISTGTRENPGHITAKGTLDVRVKGKNGIETKKVRVAGTLDVLAIDSQGNLHIYDFKTHHGTTFNEDTAIEKGYDRQLSMYAKFLEEEYGLKVKSINIIPIYSPYPAPTQKSYRQIRPGSNQLEIAEVGSENYTSFDGANFQVEKEIPLTRLNNEELVASFDKMSEVEKQSIVEAIQDQSETPTTTQEISESNIISAEPESNNVEEEESEEGGFSRKGRLGRRTKKVDTSSEATAEAINPEDKGGLLNRLKDLETSCGGKKR